MYLDSRRHSMDTWTLQPDEFAITADKEAQEYWNCKLPTLLFDGHLYLDPWDMPISVEECMAWDRDKPSIDIRQAHEASSHLLDEAIALRRWTIPQRAFVEVRVGRLSASNSPRSTTKCTSYGAPPRTLIGQPALELKHKHS